MKEMAQEEKYIKMTTQPVEKLIISLGIPTIITMLVTGFYNMTDTYFVGQLGDTSATAAVGVVFSLMSFLQAIGYFFGHGSGNYISRALGRKNVKDANTMAATGFFYSMVVGFLWLFFGQIFKYPLADFLGATDTTRTYVVEYMQIILLGAPIICPSYVLNNQLRFQGNSFFSMIGMVSGAVINIILDPILILWMDMGVQGAAFATLVGQMASFFLLLIGTRYGDSIPIAFSKISFRISYLKEIFRGGTPSLCRQGIASIATILLNQFLGGWGDSAIAAMSIVSRIMYFIQSALIGFGQGFQPVCGFNYGAGFYERVKKSFLFCVKFTVLFLCIFAVGGILFSAEIIGLFQKNDAEVLRIGVIAFRLQLVVLPFFSVITLTNMMLQTIGKVIPASVISLSRQGIMFVPAIFFMAWLFGLNGIIGAQTVSDLLSFLLVIPILKKELRILDIQIKKKKNNE